MTADAISSMEAEQEFLRGVKALREGNSLTALTSFERACAGGSSPVYSSYLGFCIARERGQIQRGTQLCLEAIDQEPENPVHYLNLGKIYLVGGNKPEAFRFFREGLRHGPDKEITELLESIGQRKTPVIPALRRDNPINKYLGIILRKLRLR